ncbi:MAG: hypothetical protein J6B06_08620 [Lachnospiraceae bacterium]|nr:hypothetical protein [Lachnospiraceae bacterium]
MSAKTKLVVFQMKELIYTGIFIALGILLILLFIFMFLPKEKNEPSAVDSASPYVAGVYTSSIVLHNQALEVEVVVDTDHINSVRLVNLNETVTTMYPLFEPVLENINEQLISGQSIDTVTYPAESQYTSQVLIESIRLALKKAEVPSY